MLYNCHKAENKLTPHDSADHDSFLWCVTFFHLQLFSDLFKNNANMSESQDRKHNHNYFMEMVSIDGMYDYMMYVGKWRSSYRLWLIPHLHPVLKCDTLWSDVIGSARPHLKGVWLTWCPDHVGVNAILTTCRHPPATSSTRFDLWLLQHHSPLLLCFLFHRDR